MGNILSFVYFFFFYNIVRRGVGANYKQSMDDLVSHTLKHQQMVNSTGPVLISHAWPLLVCEGVLEARFVGERMKICPFLSVL